MDSGLRYRKLGYVALNVSDLERSVPFYADVVGLNFVEQVGNEVVFFRCSEDHHNVALYRSASPGLKRVGFELEDDEMLERAAALFTDLGLGPEEVAARRVRDAAPGPHHPHPRAGLRPVPRVLRHRRPSWPRRMSRRIRASPGSAMW